jgi:phage gpG-like protein
MKNGLTIRVDRVQAVLADIKKLTDQQVLVGVPSSTSHRTDDQPITNAELAYIHTNGAPEANIPARPFLQPGIEDQREVITARLKATAKSALDGDTPKIEIGLAGAGQIAASAAQNKIREGLTPALKPATIAARQRRSAGSKYRRAAIDASDVKPLIDTGALLRSITYVVRKR